MTSIEEEAVKTLVSNIISAQKKANKNLPYDKTFPSIILKVCSGSRYEIPDESGAGRIIPSALPGIALKSGQKVWVKIPSGNLSGMHICGIKQ